MTVVAGVIFVAAVSGVLGFILGRVVSEERWRVTRMAYEHMVQNARREAGKLSRIIGRQRRAIKVLKAAQPAVKAARPVVPAQADVH